MTLHHNEAERNLLKEISARDPRYSVYLQPEDRGKDWTPPPEPEPLPPCLHLGAPTGESVACPSCQGSVSLKLFACAVHGTATLAKRVDGYGCCDSQCAERVVDLEKKPAIG